MWATAVHHGSAKVGPDSLDTAFTVGLAIAAAVAVVAALPVEAPVAASLIVGIEIIGANGVITLAVIDTINHFTKPADLPSGPAGAYGVGPIPAYDPPPPAPPPREKELKVEVDRGQGGGSSVVAPAIGVGPLPTFAIPFSGGLARSFDARRLLPL